MADAFSALQSSVDRLRRLVTPLDDDQLEAPAYPTDWTIAEVLSHVGSGAVIMHRRLDDALLGHDTPDDFAPSVWDIWNAKGARAKADDALAVDRALLERIDSVTESERSRFRLSMGPMDFDFAGYITLRLNEHALHTWDVEVALDPAAVLPPEAVALVIDNLDLIARFTAEPTVHSARHGVRTTDPIRELTVELSPEGVVIEPRDDDHHAELGLPAEAWIRLIYGRLDAAHAHGVTGDPELLDTLRRVFPGP